jgi:cytochrome c556
MRNRAKWTTAGIGLALLLGSAAVGVTQDKLALVTQRQDFMKAQGGDFGKISAWAKGNADQAAALAAVDDLLARRPKIADQFPPGTSATDFPDKSKAKADLWSNKDKVAQYVADLLPAEQHLRATVQSGDAQAAAKEAGQVYRTSCNACHTPFRLPAT